MMRSRSYQFSLLCLLALQLLSDGSASAGNSDGDTLCLARDGKTDYVIVAGNSANAAETFAIEELRSYLEKAAAAGFTVTQESDLPSGVHGIYVGWTEFSRSQNIDSSKLDEQEWVIKTVGQDLVLTGGRPVGSLYAVYEFLENQVGCRWLDRDTEIVPHRPALTISKLEVRTKPTFRYRTIYTGLSAVTNSSDVLAREGLFQERNKSTDPLTKFGPVPHGSPGPHHTFYAYSIHFPDDHPEYFSMNAEGKRERATSGVGPGQFCLTNPEVRKLLLTILKNFIAQDRQSAAKAGRPAPRIYDISQNDNGSFCVCPACQAFVEKEGSQSALLIDCINELADGIRDEYPDVLIMTFAYYYTLKPPKNVKPRDNVMIRLAQGNGEWTPGAEAAKCGADFFRPMSHPINRILCDDLISWAQLAKHMAIWDYWVLYPVGGAFPTPYFPTPYVNAACLQPDLQLFANNHVDNVFVECEDPDRVLSFSTLKLWLGQKLLQNPNQPLEPLLNSFMEGYYGSAAPKMREYLAYLEERIAAAPETMNLSSQPAPSGRPYLDLEFFITAHRLLTEAEQACPDDPNALAHVRQEWIPVDAAICNLWLTLERQLPQGQAMPFDRGTILQHYTDIRSAVLEQFYYGNIPAQIKSDMERDIKRYGELPAQARN